MLSVPAEAWRSTRVRGEEKEAAPWPERPEGLALPVLRVRGQLWKEAGFVSFQTLSALGPLGSSEPHPSLLHPKPSV